MTPMTFVPDTSDTQSVKALDGYVSLRYPVDTGRVYVSAVIDGWQSDPREDLYTMEDGEPV